MNTNAIIKELKETNEDFEWYPSTDEMFDVIAPYMDGGRVLDIGCGDCRFKTYMDTLAQKEADRRTAEAKAEALVSGKDYWHEYSRFDKFCEKISDYYVIEKSKTLLNHLIDTATILGTDFYQCSFLDKPAETYFCNPPYSDYETWTKKIIEEGNFKQAFLIIPERWEDNEHIKAILKAYRTSYEVLGKFDFLHADRQARAKVHVVRFTRDKYNGYKSLEDYNEDGFDIFFNNVFKTSTDKRYDYEIKSAQMDAKKQKIHNALVSADTGRATILVELYNEEIENIYKNLNAIMQLDANLLELINIDVEKVKTAVKEKYKNLKILYWSMV